MTFENMIARMRKIQDHIERMKELTDALNNEKDALEASVLVTLADHPEYYNVFIRKTSSAGMVGRNLFKVTFSTTLSRLGEYDRIDDQDWLATIESRYLRTKYELNKAVIRSDYKAGELTDGALRTMRLRYIPKASLKVSGSPEDSEVNDLADSAETLSANAD